MRRQPLRTSPNERLGLLSRCKSPEGGNKLREVDAEATIFFVHRGTIEPYLQAAILQARSVDTLSSIVLLGDQPPETIPPWLIAKIRYEPLSNYSERATAFARIFRLDGNNPFEYELTNFQRWFYLHSFCEANSLGGPFLMLDSDAYLFLSLHDVVPKLKSSMTVVDRVGPQFTFFLNYDAITQFTDFLTECFSSDSGYRRLARFVNEWGETGLPHVSDMAAIGSFASEHGLEDIGDSQRDSFIFCENIGSSQGLALSMLGKKVTVRKGHRFFTTRDRRSVLAGGVHLQGGNKVLWPYFVDKSVKRTLREFSPSDYRMARKRARAKALGIGLRKVVTSLRHLVSRPTVSSIRKKNR